MQKMQLIWQNVLCHRCVKYRLINVIESILIFVNLVFNASVLKIVFEI